MQRLSVERMGRVAVVSGGGLQMRPLRRPVCCRTAVVGRETGDAAGAQQTPTSTVTTIQPAEPVLSTSELQEAWRAGYEAGKAEAEAKRVPPAEDSLTRTALKSLTWRILSTATTITLALFVAGVQAEEALELGAMEFVSKYGLYFIHERLWTLVTFII